MSQMDMTQPSLRIVDGGAMTRQRVHPVTIAHTSSYRVNSQALWFDWAPMMILGLSATVAGIWQVVAAVAH
jgi:hypothetical protein